MVLSRPQLGFSYRPPALGRRGVVASAHQFASLAGLDMLRDGGNAVDAAVAMAATLAVVEPCSCGAGGGGFMIVRDPDAAVPSVLDFMGPAPAAATLDRVATGGGKDDGICAAAVPAAIAGWLAALQRFGRLRPERVFAPAIAHAEDGFPVSAYLHRYLTACVDRLRRSPESRAVFLPGGTVPGVGQLLRQPDMARTLRRVAEAGASAFYGGEIGEEVAAFCRRHGGLLDADDLRSYAPVWREPITTTFEGFEVHAPPPPSSAVQYLLSLNMLERLGLDGLPPDGAEHVHRLAEVFKLSVADRIRWTMAPEARWHGLLCRDYAAQRLDAYEGTAARAVEGERYGPASRTGVVAAGDPPAVDRETTTHLVAMDADGWAVACTQTLGGAFGNAIVHGRSGMLLNSLMHWFDDDSRSPNALGPGKRIEMPLGPSQIWTEGRPVALIGTPGSWGILQTTVQLIVNVLTHRMPLQTAIEAPRFRVLEGRRLAIEGRFPDDTLAELRRRGHDLAVLAEWDRFVGGAHGAVFDPSTGTFFAGADPRRDGVALGY